MAARYFKYFILGGQDKRLYCNKQQWRKGHCINLLYLLYQVFMECRWCEVETLIHNGPREGKCKHLKILYRFVFVSLVYSRKTCNVIGCRGSGSVDYSAGGMFKTLYTWWKARKFRGVILKSFPCQRFHFIYFTISFFNTFF